MGLRSDISGSKTCIQSDPYHDDRHHSQALARQYLQRLLTANLKGAGALLIAHQPILPSSFAQDAIQTV